MGRSVFVCFLVLIALSIFLPSKVFAIVVPGVINVVASPGDGNYSDGTITISVTFDGAVIVEGTPTIALNSGGTANYVGMRDGNTVLDFNYVIAAGHNSLDLNYVATTSLSGTIKSTEGNDADKTLPDSENSIGGKYSILIDTSAPTISVYPSNSSDFNSSSVVIDINVTDSFSRVKLESIVVRVDGNARNEPRQQITNGYNINIPLTSLPQGDHNFTVDVNDNLDNYASGTYTFTIDLNAPSNGSISFSGWTRLDKPTLTISETHDQGLARVQMRFSCNNSSWTNWVAYSTSYSDFNINDSSYGCSPTDTNKLVYVSFRDIAGNIDTNTYSTRVLYDSVAPSPPTGLIAIAGDGQVTLQWTAAAPDNNSGNAGYMIYKNGAYLASTSNTSYTVTGLTNNIAYTFKVLTYDVAGNQSAFTSEVSATPISNSATISVKKGEVPAEFAKNNDALTATCTYTAGVTGAKLYYKFFNPDGNQILLKSSPASTTSLAESITITTDNNNHQKIGFWCTSDSTPVSNTYYVNIDTNAPKLSWIDSQKTLTGIKRIKVSLVEKNLLKVEFSFNGESALSMINDNNTKDQDVYYHDLNTINYDNGEYELEITVTDKAGNSTSLKEMVVLENNVTPKQQAQLAIRDAIEKKAIADRIVAYYTAEKILIAEELRDKKLSADNYLRTAQTEIDTNQLSAFDSAKSAIDIFNEFNTKAEAKTKENKEYQYDKNSIKERLKSVGIPEPQANNLVEQVIKSEAERKLMLIQVGDLNKIVAKIKITFTNDTNDSKVKVIEVIPKEFVSSATKIYSDLNFRIIEDDPIIEFLVNVLPGATGTIDYSIGEIDQATADELIQNDVISKFKSPPIILGSDSRTEDLLTPDFFGTNLMWLIVGMIIVLVLVVIATFFVRFPNPGHGFGGDKSIVEHLTSSDQQQPQPQKP